MTDSGMDPTETYVLDETAVTKMKTLEELAELALAESDRDAGGSAPKAVEPLPKAVEPRRTKI